MSRKTTEKQPTKRGQSKKNKGETEPIHHLFDTQFVREYVNLVTMLIERGYEMEGTIGVDVYDDMPPNFEYTDEERENGIIKGSGDIYYKLSNDNSEIQRQLTAKYHGLESFSMRTKHINPNLEMLIYYLLPEAESGSSSERKQLSEDQVKHYVDVFDRDTTANRLMLISRVKPSADSMIIINTANQMLRSIKPLCLIRLMESSFFSFNPAMWFLQPKDLVIYRDEDKQTVLEELDVHQSLKGKEETLLPYMRESDPFALYYGLAVGDVVSFTRAEPKIVYMRVVVPDVDTM